MRISNAESVPGQGPRKAGAASRFTRLAVASSLVAVLLPVTGCRQDMHDQAKYEPFEANPMFANGMASRPLVAHTVPRGFLREDTAYYTGLGEDREPLNAFPMKALRARWPKGESLSDTEMNRALLVRGKKCFETFCTPCHDRVGTGNGIIVQRGFKAPPSLHEERLREAFPGYFVNVITEGFGQMNGYASQISPEDRWALAAYVRALQLSQNARLADLPREVERSFHEAMTAAATGEEGGSDHPPSGGHGSADLPSVGADYDEVSVAFANTSSFGTEVGES